MKYIESEERPWGRFFVVKNYITYKQKQIEIKISNSSCKNEIVSI